MLGFSSFLFILLNVHYDAALSGQALSAAAYNDTQRADFIICDRKPRINCIVDGDTFWYKGRKIRIADINTPEIFRPLCDKEAKLGHRAKIRLLQLLNDGYFSMQSGQRDRDYFGRDLRVINRNGQSLGGILISEGLAHKWRGHKESWCS